MSFRFPVTGPALDRKAVEMYFFWYVSARLANRELVIEELLNAGISGVIGQAMGTGVISYVEYMGYSHIASKECFLRAYAKDRCLRCGGPLGKCQRCLPDRLIFDLNVSAESPVVRGTWITAYAIYEAVITDRQSYEEYLASHPELVRADLEAVVEYMS